MATDLNRSADLLRRAVEANLQYYLAVGKHTVDYLKALGALAEDAGILGRSSAPALTTAAPGSPARPLGSPPDPPGPAPPAPRAAAPRPAALVLEAAPGGTATGLFMVENALAERVSAPITASPFRAEDGREVAPVLVFEPEIVTLSPGEQMLVRVSATIDEALEPQVGYRGELSVPGIAGTRVPLVLRRTPGEV